MAAAFRQAVASGSRARGLVVIAGLATGTLVGMAWVKTPQATAEAPAMNHSVTELTPTSQLSDSQNQPVADAFAVTGLPGLQRASTGAGIRKSRSRARPNRASRAYRVAVLR